MSDYAKTAEDAVEIEIDVRLPKNSEIVVIEFELVKQDHGRIIDVTKNDIQVQLEKAQKGS